ncbi:hypothetical protein [Acinetobacter sp. ANC 5045]|uniref:hypothetical protein n=1 Tax=Acinetobacter sp. ANC 5045 TaxID=2529851 RepID=UPI001040914C|nr:hypothetical protein [Acinetobacter sp. ANC 5045]TCB20426.1 hypothetical protein E0H79_03805 [Acinetobacter sp. ANC 5045]
MKYGLLAAIAVIAIAFYFMSQSNKEDAERLKQAEIAHQQKLEQQKVDAMLYEKEAELRRLQAEKAKALKAEQDKLNSQNQAQAFEQQQQAKLKETQLKKDMLQKYMDISNNWSRADLIAGSTARVALGNQVTELRKIRESLQKEKFYDCLDPAKKDLLEAMDSAIFNYVYFMQNDISLWKKQAEEKINYYNKLASSLEIYTACKQAL